MRIIKVLGFGASYIREFTVISKANVRKDAKEYSNNRQQLSGLHLSA